MNLTSEQITAVKQGKPVRVSAPEIGAEVVVVPADQFERMRECWDDEQERQREAAWLERTQQAMIDMNHPS